MLIEVSTVGDLPSIHVSLHSEESEEPELKGHESAIIKTMIKGPAAAQGKHAVTVVAIQALSLSTGYVYGDLSFIRSYNAYNVICGHRIQPQLACLTITAG